MIFKIITFTFLTAIVSGCNSTNSHIEQVRNTNGNKLTVGKVQREIKVGMSSAQVIEILGSPNIVTTDSERREVWIFDKISTETVYSSSSGGVSMLVLGVAGSVVGGITPSITSTSGANSTSQRTLTIILKFNHENALRDFAYHSSSF